MKRKFIALTYSFLIMIVWGAGMLNADGDQVTAGLSLLFTFCTTYFVQEKYVFGNYDKFLLLLFPLIYYCANIYLWGSIDKYLLFNPMNLGILFMLLNLTYLRDLKIPANLFFFTFFTIFYSYLYYPQWRPEMGVVAFDVEKFENENIGLVDSSSFKLFKNFQFLNTKNDTVQIKSSGNFILLETWSEGCPPCLKAFKELQPFYDAHAEHLNVMYIYENKKAEARQKTEKIFNYKHIRDKSKILIDMEQELYKKAEMTGYPYFLLFNPNGELVYSQRAYTSEIRRTLEQNILEAMKN